MFQLIPLATISISLYFCHYVLSFFFIASYVLGEDIVKLFFFFLRRKDIIKQLVECVVKKKVAFYVLYSTSKMWQKVN